MSHVQSPIRYLQLLMLSACLLSQEAFSAFELHRSVLMQGITEGYFGEASGDSEESGEGLRSIFVLRPSITLESESPRTVSGLRLAAQLSQIPDDEEEFRIKPELDAYVNSTIPNSPLRIQSLFLVRNSGIEASRSALAFDDDAADYATVYSANVVPSLIGNVGVNTGYSSRLNLKVVDSNDNRVVGGNDQVLDLALFTRDLSQGDIGWSLTAQYDQSNLDSGESATSTQVLAGLRTLITGDWQIFGAAGQQWVEGENVLIPEEEFADSEDSDVVTGTIWDVGVSWKPREQTEFEAVYGERIYGEWPRVSFKHSSGKSVSSLSWNRVVSRSEDGLFDVGLDTDSSEFSAGESSTVRNSLGDTLAIQDIVKIGHISEGRRSIFDFNVSWISRLSGSSRTDTAILAATFERNLTRRWSWLVSATDARQIDSDPSVVVPHYRRIGFGVRYATSRSRQ